MFMNYQMLQFYCICFIVVRLFGFTVAVFDSGNKPQFDSTSGSIVYVSQGSTAVLTWKYTVKNRTVELKNLSPIWYLQLDNGTNIQLAYENTQNRTWKLSIDCPSRLKGRLSIKDSNSLVIRNVSTDDSGIYRCTLYFTNGAVVTDNSQLIVTELPKFTMPVPPTFIRREGQDMSINCISQGKPTPIVKWVRLKDGKNVGLYSQGTGSALLRILNIRRESNGTYECQASNNPNIIIRNKTDIFVVYRPRIDSTLSSPIMVKSWDNHTVSLRCMASGNPRPEITWMDPYNNVIKYGVSAIKGGSLVIIQTKRREYGQYRCRAANTQGYVYGFFDIQKIVVPDPPILIDVKSTISIVELQWKRPTLDGGSDIIDYRVFISTNPPRRVSIKETSLIIAGLVRATKYRVEIVARNIVGFSNATSISISTQSEDAVVDEQISGSVVLGVCLPIIFILLIIIVTILVYNWWKRRKTKNKHMQPESEKFQTAVDICKTDNIPLEEGNKLKDNGTNGTPQKEYTGSCFQPFYFKRQKRRPGKSKQPRPVVILESISEENTEEEIADDSPQKKQDKNDNEFADDSARVIINISSDEESDTDSNVLS